MANVEKLGIALTPEMAGLVRGAVERGEDATTLPPQFPKGITTRHR